MDPTTTPPVAPQPNVAPPNPAPIMDIVVQKAPAVDEADAPITPPPPEDHIDAPNVTAKLPTTIAQQPHTSSAPKPKSSGVGLAIVATVVIILSLAAMAAYAYLQTAK